MKIAILGTGNVGATLGTRLIGLGHEVKMGSRTAGGEKALKWVSSAGAGASEGTFADAAAFGELILNCTAGTGSLAALTAAGSENLAGKVLLDLSNPLDFSQGMPPRLSVCNNDSLGEQIQAAFPEARVVKTLNTLWCGLMVNPQMLDNGNHHVFMAGNDADAKTWVKEQVLKAFGWKEEFILDLGDISRSRGLEMYLPFWLSVYGATGSGAFNLRLVS